jgi:hypothetical protein
MSRKCVFRRIVAAAVFPWQDLDLNVTIADAKQASDVTTAAVFNGR